MLLTSFELVKGRLKAYLSTLSFFPGFSRIFNISMKGGNKHQRANPPFMQPILLNHQATTLASKFKSVLCFHLIKAWKHFEKKKHKIKKLSVHVAVRECKMRPIVINRHCFPNGFCTLNLKQSKILGFGCMFEQTYTQLIITTIFLTQLIFPKWA